MATTTAPQQVPPQQQPPPPQQDAPSDAALIALVIAALIALHSAKAVTDKLRAPFGRAGIGPAALKAAVGLVLAMPQQPMEGAGPATRWSVRTNEIRRGAFALAAMRRIQRAADEAKAQGQPVIAAIMDAVRAEQRFFSQHVAASNQRVKAGSAVDGAAATYGNLLGWSTFIDAATTPGCLKADGKNFRVDDPPVIEGSPSYPGAVHPRCRCRPQPPRRGAPVMPGLRG